MKEISKILHEEFHKAEKRACKKLKKKTITQSERADGIVAYLSCCVIQDYKDGVIEG